MWNFTCNNKIIRISVACLACRFSKSTIAYIADLLKQTALYTYFYDTPPMCVCIFDHTLDNKYGESYTNYSVIKFNSYIRVCILISCIRDDQGSERTSGAGRGEGWSSERSHFVLGTK